MTQIAQQPADQVSQPSQVQQAPSAENSGNSSIITGVSGNIAAVLSMVAAILEQATQIQQTQYYLEGQNNKMSLDCAKVAKENSYESADKTFGASMANAVTTLAFAGTGLALSMGAVATTGNSADTKALMNEQDGLSTTQRQLSSTVDAFASPNGGSEMSQVEDVSTAESQTALTKLKSGQRLSDEDLNAINRNPDTNQQAKEFVQNKINSNKAVINQQHTTDAHTLAAKTTVASQIGSAGTGVGTVVSANEQQEATERQADASAINASESAFTANASQAVNAENAAAASMTQAISAAQAAAASHA